jgi:pimeloyl-ACP methyl ester carboxylesterase
MVEVPGRVYYVNTAFGQVVLVARPEAFKSTKPALVMFPGVSRSPVQLAEWPARLPEADVFLAGLPGVNQVPPWKETSLTNLVQAFAGTISRNLSGRPIHLAGESLGGLIALGLGTYPWASSVTAFDPPLRTGKLWPQREAVANSIDPLPWETIEGVLGIRRDGSFVDRSYLPMLAGLKCPTTIVAGTEALWPERPVLVSPSIIDDEDFEALRAYPVDVQRIDGGHLLLVDNPGVCQMLLRETIRRSPGGSGRGT